MAELRILPVPGIGSVQPGDDLAELIVAAAPWLRDGDVLVVTSKIVSKAEGRLVEVPPEEGPERAAARAAAIEAETARLVARRGPTTIVATHHGYVMAAAGVDASNVEPGRLVLLPKDPDASARSLRTALRERHSREVAVVISDTMGRPWRIGLTDVALGVAGLPPIRDHRGEVDSYGNALQVTERAVADELAAAADLVKGKLEQVPVAVVRGYLSGPPADDGPGAVAMVRDAATDMFALGTAEARAAGMADAARLPNYAPLPPGRGGDLRIADGQPEVTALADALAGVPLAPSTVVRLVVTKGMSTLVLRCGAPREPELLVALGMDVHRLRSALTASGLLTSIVSIELDDDEEMPPDHESVAIAVGRAVR